MNSSKIGSWSRFTATIDQAPIKRGRETIAVVQREYDKHNEYRVPYYRTLRFGVVLYEGLCLQSALAIVGGTPDETR